MSSNAMDGSLKSQVDGRNMAEDAGRKRTKKLIAAAEELRMVASSPRWLLMVILILTVDCLQHDHASISIAIRNGNSASDRRLTSISATAASKNNTYQQQHPHQHQRKLIDIERSTRQIGVGCHLACTDGERKTVSRDKPRPAFQRPRSRCKSSTRLPSQVLLNYEITDASSATHTRASFAKCSGRYRWLFLSERSVTSSWPRHREGQLATALSNTNRC
eukprot:805678-Rhodomonas_salina.1